MAIESLATLDLPMIVDSIEICELKGSYCTLTMINWFLQALSVIPRGSWNDVARNVSMVRWLTSPLTLALLLPSSPSQLVANAAAGTA
ncbi:lysM domain-containing GPI-anchored protein 1-like [Dorcoceras hygrometricum]|uniref:LysM domain-containing GPI-anchored protein 1-like n=1 Tax=Dorcoceras hygrometricum TaxID=472368 RepID=A0A2Z7AFI7_9LAMI|nr:lysM domain-containing GPI-anchored protein 1-like [Dorcoceras hygrometricum]